MYNTQYNRQIANEIDAINKHYINHSNELEGSGFLKNALKTAMPYIMLTEEKKMPPGLPSLLRKAVGLGHSTGQREYSKKGSKKQAVCSHCEGSGISGSGMSGSGGFGLNLPFGGFNLGWGKPEHKKLKGKGGLGFNLPFGGFNVGWGKPEPKAKKEAKGEATPKKRGNPNLSKRAEIVKKVMKEQGLSMIKASQYVKAHNLY